MVENYTKIHATMSTWLARSSTSCAPLRYEREHSRGDTAPKIDEGSGTTSLMAFREDMIVAYGRHSRRLRS